GRAYLLAPPLCFVLLVTDPPPTEIYTLSLHDALPIFEHGGDQHQVHDVGHDVAPHDARVAHPEGGGRLRILQLAQLHGFGAQQTDRKSTRLNSSHVKISYAVFCLKKKNQRVSDA